MTRPISIEDARGLATLWREQAEANRYARTFVAILDAMPEDDPDELLRAVVAIVRDLPRQFAELTAVIDVSGAWLQSVGGPWEPGPVRGPSPDTIVLDELLGFPTESVPDTPPAAAPESPETAPNPESGPPGPRQAGKDALRAFLDGVDPGNLPMLWPELVDLLDELERLAIAAGVWEPGTLDEYAEKWLDAPAEKWRNAPHAYQLRTFAARVVLTFGKEPA